MEDFLHDDFGGLIHGGAYFRNFMVCQSLVTNLFYNDFWTILNSTYMEYYISGKFQDVAMQLTPK